MWFTKKKGQGDKLVLDTINKLNKLKRQRTKQDSSEKLNEIIRTFLEEKYKIKQSLTLEEAMKVLKKKRMNKQAKLDIARILIEVYEKEYKTKTSLTKKQLIILVNKTKQTLTEICA